MLRQEAALFLAAGGSDALFSRYAAFPSLLVAISGGPDSMALLLLARAWAREPGRPRLFAATVDHGLRPSSRSEAQQVAAWCGELGVPHRLLVWEGEKPSARIQERAREARYALLDACARRLGAPALLTGHHADDQYETVLFRLLRGSGIAGLAGMAETSLRGDLLHGRPLLGQPKAALIAVCEAANQPFVQDLSNNDPRFARTGLRRAAELLRESGFGPQGLLRLSARAARADAALTQAADALASDALVGRDKASAQFRAQPLAQAAEELALRILCREIERISRSPHVRLERAEALTRRFQEQFRAGEPFCATLGGVIVRTSQGLLTLRKEGRVGEKPRLAPKEADVCLHPVLSLTPRSLGKGERDA